jgi:hypothetical protein
MAGARTDAMQTGNPYAERLQAAAASRKSQLKDDAGFLPLIVLPRLSSKR